MTDTPKEERNEVSTSEASEASANAVDLERLEKLLAEATPGPWHAHKHAHAAVMWGGMLVANCGAHTDNRRGILELLAEQRANAELTVAMRNALPSLIATIRQHEGEARQLRKELEQKDAEIARLRDLVKRFVNQVDPDTAWLREHHARTNADLMRDARAALNPPPTQAKE